MPKHFVSSSGRSSRTVDCRATAPRERLGVQATGQKCAACEETMAHGQLMMEIYWLMNNKKSVRFHGECYTLWNDELRRLKS